ncbi:putative immunity protein [Streptomyces dangxiongensis]|uniref:putative immunity protein n=1 Tax=Streptomyces dangxiongensis TaxID=1442032 RepID=UPI00267CCFF8
MLGGRSVPSSHSARPRGTPEPPTPGSRHRRHPATPASHRPDGPRQDRAMPKEPNGPDTIELSADELREIAGWAADCALGVLALFEESVPADPRPREAVEAARAFAAGGRRTAALRQSAWAAYRAAREATSPAAAEAARAASHAAGAAFLHPRASAHQVRHVLGAAAHAVRAGELAAGEPGAGELAAGDSRDAGAGVGEPAAGELGAGEPGAGELAAGDGRDAYAGARAPVGPGRARRARRARRRRRGARAAACRTGRRWTCGSDHAGPRRRAPRLRAGGDGAGGLTAGRESGGAGGSPAGGDRARRGPGTVCLATRQGSRGAGLTGGWGGE